LSELGRAEPDGLVFCTELRQADSFATFGSQPTLWAPHLSVYSGTDSTESLERFYHYAFYSGVTPSKLRELLLAKHHVTFIAIFGYGRESPLFVNKFVPVAVSEIDEKVQEYHQYVESFGREDASKDPVRFAVIPTGDSVTANLQRFYEMRDEEQIGRFKIYRVELRP
jgi:hypothetical protein